MLSNAHSRGVVDVKDLLRHSPLFEGLDDAVLDEMLSHFRRETWRQGRQVDGQQCGERFHIILAGRLKMGQINADTGRMVTLFLLQPGDAFDVISLLDGQPDPLIFEARDDLMMLSTPMQEARRWIEQHPDFNRSFLPYLGQQMRTLANLAGDLALHDTETRLARLILRHVQHEEPGQPLRLIHNLSHEALAEMIGSVRVVVNRQLQHWQRDGVVVTRRGELIIKELETLLKKAMHLSPFPHSSPSSRSPHSSHHSSPS